MLIYDSFEFLLMSVIKFANKNFNRHFFIDQRSSSEFIIDNDGYVNVYTDGACGGNGSAKAQAGIGVWFGDNHPLYVSL